MIAATDVQARVVAGSDGTVYLYLFSDEKTAGGASKRWCSLSVDDGEACLLLGSRDPDKHDVSEVTIGTMGEAMLRAFAHVQTGESRT